MSNAAIWAAVALGGALGALVRGALYRSLVRADEGDGRKLATRFGSASATLLVNIAGSCLLGGLLAGYAQTSPSDPLRVLWMTGFCGSLTTFSTFCADAIEFLREGERGRMVAYLLASGTLCLLAFAGGALLVESVGLGAG